MLEQLISGQVDGIFESPFAIDNIRPDYPGSDSIVEYPLEIIADKFHFMFSKKTVSKSFVIQFNQALEKVKDSKKYQSHWYWSTVR